MRMGYDNFNAYSEQNEVFLVSLPNTVVHPRTVMIHFTNATLANGAMVSTFRLNATTLRTFEDHLALLEAHLLDVFFGSVSSRDSTLIMKCKNVTRERIENLPDH